MANIKLVCLDCKNTFVFSSGEQAYYQSKALSQPKRCRECRERRKATLVPDSAVRLAQ